MVIDQRPLRAAESAVSARKALLAQQWAVARSRISDKLVNPLTLLTVAAAGGVLGWRGAAPRPASEEATACECPQNPSPPGSGVLRSLAIAGLQAVATIASEEFVRSTMARGEQASGSATADAADASR